MITLPVRDLSISQRQEYMQRSLAVGYAEVKRKGLAVEDRELVSLDLGPENLGLSDWATPVTQGGGFTTWINHMVSNWSAICIYKFLQLSLDPAVSTLEFLRNRTVIGINELEHCYGGLPIVTALARALMSREAKEVLDRLAGNEAEVSPDLGFPMEGYFSEPYVWGPGDQMNILVKSRRDSPGNYIVLGGFVIERRGNRVQ